MNKQVFAVIGTDTEIGKTYSCCRILEYLVTVEKKVTGLKPIASGVLETPLGVVNSDSYAHYQASNVKLTIDKITPFCFKEAIAPHIAAINEDVDLNSAIIADKINFSIAASEAEIIIVEGVGGLMVPLNYQETYLDLLKRLGLPIILVVGVKLGCLNHVLLTNHVLLNHGLKPVGFIANCLDEAMPYLVENIATLEKMLSCDLLATINYGGGIEPTAKFNQVFGLQ
ncbi:dethiobiotin synthase [Aquella oligotrophica]|uniref:ATP-dependent dethiobiotin synthetase BioD n=1 Tax=Aquella oligotrophica TaxID=2067065 RepID=A0A2I7N3Q3_9NEIS|nr:dethiobiotin synthase [Aquella oligotrophica]AUR51087.1 dethiobiotin synthase [Aquella oligotrophica]